MNNSDSVQFEDLSEEFVKGKLPYRSPSSHKGSFGKVLVFGGCINYPGSAILAGKAAYRAGAGVVTILTNSEMYPIYASHFLEATYIVSDYNTENISSYIDNLKDQLNRYNVFLIGPGLGVSDNMKTILSSLLQYINSLGEKHPIVVIDADGLNNLASIQHWWEQLPKDSILTPHLGEMKKLCSNENIELSSDELFKLAVSKSKDWNTTLVLKQSRTVIISPLQGQKMCKEENPLLATAGTGDVLAGIISGLLAQRMESFNAACSGVYIHSLSAKNLISEFADSGMLASDLLMQIPLAISKIKTAK